MTAEKILENKLRRIAERRGYRIEKSRRRDPQALDYGKFTLVNVQANAAQFGIETLDQIAEFFGEKAAIKPKTKAKGRK